MTYTQAVKYLKRAERNGYVRYHSGIASFETSKTGKNGFTRLRYNYGINIDGDGLMYSDGRHLFGCPRIIWDIETAEIMFPTKRNK